MMVNYTHDYSNPEWNNTVAYSLVYVITGCQIEFNELSSLVPRITSVLEELYLLGYSIM
jgi:hypothetical protein